MPRLTAQTQLKRNVARIQAQAKDARAKATKLLVEARLDAVRCANAMAAAQAASDDADALDRLAAWATSQLTSR